MIKRVHSRNSSRLPVRARRRRLKSNCRSAGRWIRNRSSRVSSTVMRDRWCQTARERMPCCVAETIPCQSLMEIPLPYSVTPPDNFEAGSTLAWLDSWRGCGGRSWRWSTPSFLCCVLSSSEFWRLFATPLTAATPKTYGPTVNQMRPVRRPSIRYWTLLTHFGQSSKIGSVTNVYSTPGWLKPSFFVFDVWHSGAQVERQSARKSKTKNDRF